MVDKVVLEEESSAQRERGEWRDRSPVELGRRRETRGGEKRVVGRRRRT